MHDVREIPSVEFDHMLLSRIDFSLCFLSCEFVMSPPKNWIAYYIVPFVLHAFILGIIGFVFNKCAQRNTVQDSNNELATQNKQLTLKEIAISSIVGVFGNFTNSCKRLSIITTIIMFLSNPAMLISLYVMRINFSGFDSNDSSTNPFYTPDVITQYIQNPMIAKYITTGVAIGLSFFLDLVWMFRLRPEL
mgnify:CR=1 FL=1